MTACVGATSSRKEELILFITSVNSFRPALNTTGKFPKIHQLFSTLNFQSINNGLSTSVHYKPTDSHSYLRHSSSHPQHVKNAIPFSQFLRLRRLYSDDSDFNNKCEELCQFFKNTRLPWLCYNHMQTSRPRNRLTPQNCRNQFIHPHLPSTKTLPSKMSFSKPSKFSTMIRN